jgi:hypothetical protein
VILNLARERHRRAEARHAPRAREPRARPARARRLRVGLDGRRSARSCWRAPPGPARALPLGRSCSASTRISPRSRSRSKPRHPRRHRALAASRSGSIQDAHRARPQEPRRPLALGLGAAPVRAAGPAFACGSARDGVRGSTRDGHERASCHRAASGSSRPACGAATCFARADARGERAVTVVAHAEPGGLRPRSGRVSAEIRRASGAPRHWRRERAAPRSRHPRGEPEGLTPSRSTPTARRSPPHTSWLGPRERLRGAQRSATTHGRVAPRGARPRTERRSGSARGERDRVSLRVPGRRPRGLAAAAPRAAVHARARTRDVLDRRRRAQ